MNISKNENHDYGYGTDPEWKPATTESSPKFDIELQMRLGFIRKVYGIVSVQLVLTTVLCACSVVFPSFAKFQHENTALLWVSLFCSIICLLVLTCFPIVARTVPTNYILLTIFTLFEAYLVSTICSTTSPRIVLMAASMTCALTLGLTIYACITKSDFTVYNTLFFIGTLTLFFFGFFLLFTQNKVIHIVFCCAGVLMYSLYLVYDTQLLIGNKENRLEADDYIYGAMMLYLDIINIFVFLLRLLKLNE